MHTFFSNLFHLIYPRHVFEQVIVRHQEEFCKNSLQYFTMHLMRRLVAGTIRMVIRSGGVLYKQLKVFHHESWEESEYHSYCVSDWTIFKMHGEIL